MTFGPISLGGGGGGTTIIRTTEVRDGDAAANPKVQIRTRAPGGATLQAPGQYSISGDTLQVGFADETQAQLLRDTTNSVILRRAGEAIHTRLAVTGVVVVAVAGTPEFYSVSMGVVAADAPAWFGTAGDTDFYFDGDLGTTDALALGERNTLGAFNAVIIPFRTNTNAGRLTPARDGHPRAQIFSDARNWAYLANDEDFAEVKRIYESGHILSITFRAHLAGTPDADELGTADKYDTYDADRLTFAPESQRAVSGNRINVEFAEDVDVFYRNTTRTTWFAAQYNTTDPEHNANLGLHFSGNVSMAQASATDRVVNLGTRRGVRYSANPEEQAAAIASGMRVGDDVEMAGFDRDGKLIPGAHVIIPLESDIVYNGVPGTMQLEWSSDVLPTAFADARRMTIDLHAGSSRLVSAEVYAIISTSTGEGGVFARGTDQPTSTSRSIRNIDNHSGFQWSTTGREQEFLRSLNIRPKDLVVLEPFDRHGAKLDSGYKKHFTDHNGISYGSGFASFTSGRSQLSNRGIRQAAFVRLTIYPGFAAMRNAGLIVQADHLGYHGDIITGVPSATAPGIYPNVGNLIYDAGDAQRVAVAARAGSRLFYTTFGPDGELLRRGTLNIDPPITNFEGRITIPVAGGGTLPDEIVSATEMTFQIDPNFVLPGDLAPYATTAEVSTALVPYATTSALQAGYATFAYARDVRSRADANATAIAANTTAIAAGTGATDDIAHIAARSDVLHIVAARTDDTPSATNRRIQFSSSVVSWYANAGDRAIVLGLGFVRGDTIIVEGRDANNSPVGSVACPASGDIGETTGFVFVVCDTTLIPTAILTAAFISLTLIPSRGNDLAIAANTAAIAASTASATADRGVLHIVADRSATGVNPSATNQKTRVDGTTIFWYQNPNDRAAVLEVGFATGDRIIIEGRNADDTPVETAVLTSAGGIFSSAPDFLNINTSTTIPVALRNAARVSLTLLPSRGAAADIATNAAGITANEASVRTLISALADRTTRIGANEGDVLTINTALTGILNRLDALETP